MESDREKIINFLKKPNLDQLNIEKIFSSGSQGVCGLIKINIPDVGNNVKMVFKVSQYIDYVVEHEYKAMKLLDEIKTFCPHYSLPYGIYSANTEAKIKEDKNPFIVKSKYPIRRSFILEEFIDGQSFKHLLNNSSDMVKEHVTKNQFKSIVKQILASINISGKNLGFSHYDLHSSNILVESCDVDNVNFYIFPTTKGKKFNGILVPSFGVLPKIIDMGFAYANGMNGKEVTIDLSHSDSGHFCDRYSWLTDYKVFLVSLYYDIKHTLKEGGEIFGDENGGDEYMNIVKNIFKPLNLSWHSGWDKYKNEEASDKTLRKIFEHVKVKSGIFKESPHSCFDIIISLCSLPLVDTHTFQQDIRKCFPAFLTEFFKIEDEITVPIYRLNMLKIIVDSAKIYKEEYINEETRKSALQKFKLAIESEVTRISKFCLPRINYEIMLCSVYSLAYCYTSLLKRYIDKTFKDITETYVNIVPETGDEIIEVFNVNMEDEYVYNTNSTINVYDSVSKKYTKMELLQSEVEYINSLPHYAKGEFVYVLYNSLS